jgi:SPP1 family predicted phage head-tail adaptor
MAAAGKRKTLVKIQQLGTTQDEIGQTVEGWVDFTATAIYANIKHRTGAEALRGDRDTSIVQVSIQINKRAGVTNQMRVLQGSTAYKIVAVLPDETEKDKMFLLCEQVQS